MLGHLLPILRGHKTAAALCEKERQRDRERERGKESVAKVLKLNGIYLAQVLPAAGQAWSTSI